MSESAYDSEIAPKLLEIGKRCKELGMSFVALVEYSPGETGRTHTQQPNACNEFLLTAIAAQTRGNIDALAISWARHARKVGHGSIVLRNLGVPLEPELK